MNPGIFYLYEYNNTQKLRNAGFLKITRYYHACTLQLNARGIPVSYADSIKLYVFYMENGQAETAVLTEITCANHALSARMTSAESQFPGGRPLEKVDGFFLKLPNGHILAAAAPGMVIDTQKLLSASADTASAGNSSTSVDTASQKNTAASDDMELQPKSLEGDMTFTPTESTDREAADAVSPDHAEPIDVISSDNAEPVDAVSSDNAEPIDVVSSDNAKPVDTESSDNTGSADSTASVDMKEPIDTPDGTESAARENNMQDSETAIQLEAESVHERMTDKNMAVQNHSTETDSPPEQSTSEKQDSPQQNVRKIQRSELSILPRKYWHLANNSFLLHGYHNYNHLILVQKDGHYWLGVPGIYDPREARAARLFGFPQFTDSYNKYLRLSDDECDPQGNFGYWCCYLK